MGIKSPLTLGQAQPREDSSPSIDAATHQVLDVAHAMLDETDVESVISRILESARELAGARYAAIGIVGEDGTKLVRFLTAGIDDATSRRIGLLPSGRGVLGELIANPVPLRVANLEDHPRSFGFPMGHPTMHTFLGVPIFIADEHFGSLYLTEKHGGEQFTDDDEATLVLLAAFAGLAIDHTRRYADSERRRVALQRNVEALDATVQIARTLAGQTDLDLILELVAKRGRDLVSARTLVIELIDGDDLIIAAGAGVLPEGEVIGRRVEIRNSVAGTALQSLRAQRLADDLSQARLSAHGLGRLGLPAEAGLVVPLALNGRAYGVLVAVDRLVDGPEFSARDEELLEAFAASAATAVATAQSVTAQGRHERLEGAEGERGRWARDLHDGTLQSLAVMKMRLSAARRSADPAALTQVLAQTIDELESEIIGIRAMITELRPAALDQLGVGSAVEALTERAMRNGLEVDLTVDLAYERGRAPDHHAPDLETAIYRIVQEALTNASKHGSATSAVVEVLENDSIVEVSIRDDGDGFDPEGPTNGFGLIGMRERAELVLGKLDVDSVPGQGTLIRATLPVQHRGALRQSAEDRRLVG
jgi:two-component system, NarL family, sensor histidine kinase DevS